MQKVENLKTEKRLPYGSSVFLKVITHKEGRGFTPSEITEKLRRKAKFLTAFTLIELVMVIVIVGILAAIAVPRFESFYAIKLDGATKKVVSDIRYIQQFAVSRHSDSRVEFDATANSYQGCYCNEADGNCDAGGCADSNWSSIPDPFTRADLNVDFNTDSQYKGIGISSPNFEGTDTLRFDWQGIPQDENGNNLSSEGSVNLSYHQRSRTILVEPNTGRVSVQ